MSRGRGRVMHEPRYARATLAGVRSGVASGDGPATCAPSDRVRRAIVLPGDDGPSARPPGSGNPCKSALGNALRRVFAHPSLLGAEPNDHEAVAADVHSPRRSPVCQEEISGSREPPCLRTGWGRFATYADGGLSDPFPPPAFPPGPQYRARARCLPLRAAIHGEMEGRLVGEGRLGSGSRFRHGARRLAGSAWWRRGTPSPACISRMREPSSRCYIPTDGQPWMAATNALPGLSTRRACPGCAEW